jgi:hypothetical protein
MNLNINSNSDQDPIDQIIEQIFTQSIKSPYHYQLEFETDPNLSFKEQTQYLFNQLSNILHKGFRYLFPHVYTNDIFYISKLTTNDFHLCNSYFHSFGYRLSCNINLPTVNNSDTLIRIDNNNIQTKVVKSNNFINEDYINSLLNEDNELENSLPELPENDHFSSEKMELNDYKTHIVDPITKSIYEISFDFF